MSIELREMADGKILEIHASGKLNDDDYHKLVPEVERLMSEHGKIRILFDMEDFHGWTIGALWQDIKFDRKHSRDIERVAMIGDKAWQHGMAVFCRPFTSAEVRYFERNEADEATAWIWADLPIAKSTVAVAK